MLSARGTNNMSKENGNTVTEVTFKKNVDYFEMAEGTLYTVDALMQKYDSGKSTIYNKARDAGMEVVKIAGFPCFMDDAKIFSKKERIYDTKHLKPMTSYGELVNIVKDIHRACTIPEEKTSSRLATIEALLLNTVEHQKANNKLLTDILNHLTKGEKKDDSSFKRI